MSLSDPLGDMLTRIRNGQHARKSTVESPASRLRSNVLEVLKREGYIRDYSAQGERAAKTSAATDHDAKHKVTSSTTGSDDGDGTDASSPGVSSGSAVNQRPS